MMKVFLLLALAGLSAARFLPTKTGGAIPEVFWFQNDRGVLVPALLHGRNEKMEGRAVEDDVEFWLYNNKNLANPVTIFPGCWTCMDTFVKGAPVVIMVHGFGSDHLGGFGENLRLGFAQAPEEINLIFVNWAKLAASPWYETAANNVKPVGAYTASLVEFLINGGFSVLSDFSYAGHSLGSHVANHVSGNLSPGMRLPVIHALDPALPLFGEKPDSERIDPTDADFVNVIHTAMGTLLDGGLAFTEPRGHIDFYPNSGKNQPGCGADLFGACSHSRAYQLFGESVYSRDFVACQCSDWDHYLNGCTCANKQILGWATPRDAKGIFYLTTSGTPPYAIGDSNSNVFF